MSASFFVCDKNYCDNTRSCDDMLLQFEKDRESLTFMLNQNPKKLSEVLWSNRSPISKDTNCLFNMSKSVSLSIDDILEKNVNPLVNYYVCPQCRNMKRLIDFNETKPNDAFPLQCGKKVGYLLYYEEKPIN